MPARDKHHHAFKNALIKEGWIVTDDPLYLKYGQKEMYVDLGAEEVIAAEKGTLKIAVEIKSFLGRSEMADLEKALGQFIVYRDVMSVLDPDRKLWLAVPDTAFVDQFEDPLGRLLMERQKLLIIVFDPVQEEIKQWIPPSDDAK